jgi:hypothetical protein
MLPMITAARNLILTLLLVAGGVWLFAPGGGIGWLLENQVDQRSAIEFFRREPLSFLVTERIVTQVVVERHEGTVLFGSKDGFLFGTVELLYGVDLASLDPTAVRQSEDGIRVRVPAPTLLRAVPDLESVRFLQKRSPMVVFADKMMGEDLYRRCLLELDDAAVAFVKDHELAPTRQLLVERLNDYSPAIASQIGTRVVFE